MYNSANILSDNININDRIKSAFSMVGQDIPTELIEKKYTDATT